jgi:hypothetical protein
MATLTIGSTVSGTATGVAGDGVTTVTATTSIFNASMVGQTLTVADETETPTILTCTSGTVVVVDGEYDFAGKAVSVSSNGIYNAPADFGGLATPMVYAHRSAGMPRLTQTSPERVFAYWRDQSTPQSARWFSLVPVAASATSLQTFQFVFASLPDEEVAIVYRYRKLAGDVTDAAGQYLPGAPMHCRTHMAAAQAEAEAWAGRDGGLYEGRYVEAMVDSIEDDADLDPVGEETLLDEYE